VYTINESTSVAEPAVTTDGQRHEDPQQYHGRLIAKYDYELRALSGTGLTDVELDLVVQLIGDYVHGAARSAVSATQVARATGQTDEQWWAEWAPLLEKVFDPDRYPTAARVGSAAGAEYGAATDPDRAFDFGLARLLDGVATLVHTRTGHPDRHPA
jgi:hypothetical protein